MESSERKNSKCETRLKCLHCNQLLNVRAWRQHKKKYYTPGRGVDGWQKVTAVKYVKPQAQSADPPPQPEVPPDQPPTAHHVPAPAPPPPPDQPPACDPQPVPVQPDHAPTSPDQERAPDLLSTPASSDQSPAPTPAPTHEPAAPLDPPPVPHPPYVHHLFRNVPMEFMDTEVSLSDSNIEGEGNGNSMEQPMEVSKSPSQIPYSPNAASPLSKESSKAALDQHFAYFLQRWQTANLISNSAMDGLLKFTNDFLNIATKEGISLQNTCPPSTYMLRSKLDIEVDDFKRYIVCGECHQLYTKEQVIYKDRHGVEQARCCLHEQFEEGRGKYARPCGATLMNKVVLSKGDIQWQPIHTYVYKSITNSLVELLQRPHFEEMCNEWRSRPNMQGKLADVYDGRVWKENQVVNGRPFLAGQSSYAFTINFDFFNPYDRKNDRSVGALYLTVMNAPRSERNKWENAILLGIIPSTFAHEPPCINTFIKPFVTEMQALWAGKKLPTHTHPEGVSVRAALLCVASDSPATAKLIGTLSHSANLGCKKCLKVFHGKVGKKRYGGFSGQWIPRTKAEHNRNARRVAAARNVTNKRELERKLGCRYSVLIELPYFDAIRYAILDPMHLLFLGVMKTFFTILVEKEILSPKKLAELETEIRMMSVPYDVGRLPRAIASNWRCFNAQEWKAFVLQYGPIVLKPIIPTVYYKVFQTFSLACQKICSPCITTADVEVAHGLFINFGRMMEKAFNPECITPNIHGLVHMKECILDFSTPYAYWCFNFERYNGQMGAYPTNNKSIEVQMMRHFQTECQLNLIHPTLPKQFSATFSKHYSSLVRGVTEKEPSGDANVLFVPQHPLDQCRALWANKWPIGLPKCSLKIIALKSEDVNNLSSAYSSMYPSTESISATVLVHEINTLSIQSQNYGSLSAGPRCKQTHVFAKWTDDNGLISDMADPHLGQIIRFVRHTITLGEEQHTHILAQVKWHLPITEETGYKKPATPWFAEKFVRKGPSSFIPVQRLMSRAVTCHRVVCGYRAIVAIGLQPKVFV